MMLSVAQHARWRTQGELPAVSPMKKQEPFRQAVSEALRFLQVKARGTWQDRELLNQTGPGPTI